MDVEAESNVGDNGKLVDTLESQQIKIEQIAPVIRVNRSPFHLQNKVRRKVERPLDRYVEAVVRRQACIVLLIVEESIVSSLTPRPPPQPSNL